MKKKKLLYLAGMGRSGSTIIGKILGNYPDVFHAGELCFIWDRAHKNNDLCGCGKPFRDCETWRKILSSDLSAEDWTENNFRFDSNTLPKNLDLIKSTITGHEPAIQEESIDYRENLSRLYNAIYKNTNCQLLVDGSKLPTYLSILANKQEYEIYVIHLVRDLGATVYSWSKRIERQDSRGNSNMETYSLLHTAKKWLGWNIALHLYLNKLEKEGKLKWQRLSYTEFTSSPSATIDSILSFADYKSLKTELPNIKREKNIFYLQNDHAIWGNPNRHTSGAIEIKEDSQWKRALPFKAKLLTWALSIPFAIFKK